MPEKVKKRHHGILHANKEHQNIRHKLLYQIREKKGVSVMVIKLNKKKVSPHLRNKKSLLYNYVAKILLDRIIRKEIVSSIGPVHLIASRRETNRFFNDNFKSYLEKELDKRVLLEVRIKAPAQEKCLQVIGFISWAVFRNYEHADSSYFDIIKNLIVEESSLP